ncbi:hypothetical protein M422DRAFT_169299, partial [Sphaerobolus stellatus SS14]
YLEIRAKTEDGRLAVPPALYEDFLSCPCTCKGKQQRLGVVAAYWDRFENITIHYCQCKPASVALLLHGLFPSAPLRPSLALDINLLDLVTTNMHYNPPNVSGWALSLEWFWRERGYILGRRESLKKCFGSALQWYTYLKVHAAGKVDASLVRMNDTPDRKRKLDAVTISEAVETPKRPKATPPSRLSSESDDGPSPERRQEYIFNQAPGPTTENPPQGAHSPSQPSLPTQPEPLDPPKGNSLSRPSSHLRSCCPACFGGNHRPALKLSPSDVLVCLDANFAQSCLESSSHDPPFSHPQTYFLSIEEVSEMEQYVEAARTTKSKRTLKGKGTNPKPEGQGRVSDDILEECMKSFIAAREEVSKASLIYIDTGLVALLCRHDRVLWIANMTTPGEKQFYAFALLKKLMDNLPADWTVGLLYDIACQIERSMRKHSILHEYLSRLTFAVSVFHAFGHQWPCQLNYHPQKCIGFGRTDGEGCERFWSTLKHLIPSLRVSGHFRRIWTLDLQAHHNSLDGMRNLALIIARKRSKAVKVAQEVEEELETIGLDDKSIVTEWCAQVEFQTAKLPRQSRSAGDKAIDHILELRHQVAEWKSKLATLIRNQKDLQAAGGMPRANIIEDDVQVAQEALTASTKRLIAAEKQLNIPARKKLEKLKGNQFLRHQMNARALKTRIRAKLMAHNFERSRRDALVKQHVMTEKDHAKTKSLLNRTKGTTYSLIRQYNELVDEMQNLRAKGVVPQASRIPFKLEGKAFFKLDVDNPVWYDEAEFDGDEGEVPPLWLSDNNMRAAITAYLARQRSREEEERIIHEIKSIRVWIQEEKRVIKNALSHANSGSES